MKLGHAAITLLAGALSLLLGCGRSAPQAVAPTKALLPDDQIRSAVVKRFAENPRLKGLHIVVEIRRGEVVLSGPVPNEQVKHEAADTARDVPEIAGVDSESLSVEKR